jgi:hypothetical protein
MKAKTLLSRLVSQVKDKQYYSILWIFSKYLNQPVIIDQLSANLPDTQLV